MNNAPTLTPIFNRKKKLNNKGTALIQIRIYLQSQNKYLSTGIYLEPKYWDDKRLKVKSTHHNVVHLNKLIYDKIRNIETWHTQRINENTMPTIMDILDYAKNGNQSNTSFLAFMEKQIPIHATGKYTKSEAQYNSTYSKLVQFKPDTRFMDLNFQYLEELSYWLSNTYKKPNGGLLHPTSIHKVFKHVKLFVTLATKKGICETKHNPFLAGFKISEFVKKVESKPNFLSIDELNIIEITHDTIEDGAMKKITESFLFQCYTGFRHTDLISIKKSDVITSNKKTVINKKQNKTQNAVSIPVSLLFNGAAMPIPEKRLANCSKDEDLLFPNLPQQYYNRELKGLQKMCNIRMKLTSHVGRHTFGTMLTSLGVAIADISSLMGHKNITTTMIYAKVINDDRDNRLSTFFK